MLRSFAPPSCRSLALGAVVLTTALWGLSYPLTKDLVAVYPPGQLAALRLAIALGVLLPVLLWQGRRPVFSRCSIALGLTGVAMYQLLQNTGMQSVSAGGSVIVLYGAIVILSALLGRCVLGEACSKLVLGALAISAAGVGLVANQSTGDAEVGWPVVGVALLVAAAGAFAVYAVIGRKAAETDLLALNAGALLVGLVGILPFAAREQRPAWDAVADRSDLLALVTLGALVTTGSYVCWSYGLRHLQVTEASVLSAGEPVFGLLFAWVLLREAISWQEGVGVAVIFGGCLLIVLDQTWFQPGAVAPLPDQPAKSIETRDFGTRWEIPIEVRASE